MLKLALYFLLCKAAGAAECVRRLNSISDMGWLFSFTWLALNNSDSLPDEPIQVCKSCKPYLSIEQIDAIDQF